MKRIGTLDLLSQMYRHRARVELIRYAQQLTEVVAYTALLAVGALFLMWAFDMELTFYSVLAGMSLLSLGAQTVGAVVQRTLTLGWRLFCLWNMQRYQRRRVQ